MASVWEAMKKHQAEEAAAAARREPAPAPPAPGEQAASAPPERGEQPRPPDSREPEQGHPVILEGPVDSHKIKTVIKSQHPVHGFKRNAVVRQYSAGMVPHHDRGGKIAEQYRALRTTLLANCQGSLSCLITSAQPQEGKTTTCANLALVLAENVSQRTVIIDGDLRQGRIADMMHLDRTPGLAELLRGRAEIREVIQPTAYPNLSIVAAGHSRPEEVAELLSRPELDPFFADIRRMFDYVLVDTPSINKTSDAGMLGRWIEQALVVVQMNRTRRESVDRALGLLQAANIKPAGIVMTHHRYYIPNYLYKVS